MVFNTALYNYLKSYTELSALVSDRIYPDELPQNPTYPAITYEQTDEEEISTFQTPDSNLRGPYYEFTASASTRASAKAVAEQLRLAFKNYSGVMGGEGGITVSAVEKINGPSDGLAYNSDGKMIAYETTIEFQIWYQE